MLYEVHRVPWNDRRILVAWVCETHLDEWLAEGWEQHGEPMFFGEKPCDACEGQRPEDR